jgi:hypothetical protein
MDELQIVNWTICPIKKKGGSLGCLLRGGLGEIFATLKKEGQRSKSEITLEHLVGGPTSATQGS